MTVYELRLLAQEAFEKMDDLESELFKMSSDNPKNVEARRAYEQFSIDVGNAIDSYNKFVNSLEDKS